MNISEKSKKIIDSCRFCWMCRHVCPIGNATGLERNTARARALGASLVVRGATELQEIAKNAYECALCGACTNNCMTGWDPKVFIQELKTEIVLNGVAPNYILSLIQKYQQTGNVYGKTVCSCLNDLFDKKGKIGLFVGQDALYNTPELIKKVVELLMKAGVEVDLLNNQDSGAALWFLTGKTEETQNAMKNCVKSLNEYETVIVYDPCDLKLMKHEFNEFGLELKAEIVSFNEYILNLIKNGKLKVKKGDNEYTLQDSYFYARDLDDVVVARKIIECVGVNKEMLLNAKETNMAGHLIMNEYMPEVIKAVAINRWINAKNMDCKTLVTESPQEYVLLKENTPNGYRVLSVEEMLLENI